MRWSVMNGSGNLTFRQLGENSALGHEFVIGAGFYNFATHEDVDTIRIPDSAQAMSDDDACGLQPFQAFTYLGLADVVQSAGSLIEQHHAGLSHDGP